MEDNFSLEVKEVLVYSKEEAFRLENNFIDTSHLLLGVIRYGNGDVYNQYIEPNIKPITKVLEKINEKDKWAKKPKNLHLTRQAERALKTTFLEAKLFQDIEINLFHLFLCILRNENDPTTKFLNKNYSIDYDFVKDNYKSKRQEKEHTIKKTSSFFKNLHIGRHYLEYSIDNSNLIQVSFDYRKERMIALNSIKGLRDTIKYISINDITTEEKQIIKEFRKLEKLEIKKSKINSSTFFSELNLIENLILNECEIESTENFPKSKKLIHLDLSNCHFPSSSLDDLEFLKKINSIEHLNLKGCLLKSVDSLPNLNQLKHLDISNNQIKNIDKLRKYKSLCFLNLSFNKIADIEALANKIHKGLKIFIDNNNIESLSEKILLKIYQTEISPLTSFITHLKNVKVQVKQYEEAAKLRDYEKKAESSPADKLSDNDLKYIKRLYLETSFKRNPIVSPPLEIILEGIEDIKDYFKQSKKDNSQKYLYEGKLLVIGEGGTGKTSFARKIEDIKASLPTDKETTFNIDIKQINFNIKDKNSSKMFINIWDFGGQKIYRGTHQLFFSDKCLYVLVDDNREEKTDFSYWLNTVEQLGGKDSKLIIVINLKHGRKNISFDETGYKKQFSEINFDVIPIDLLNDEDSLEILKDLIKVRFRELPLIGNPLPTSWVDIREELSTINDYFISYDKFTDLCNKHSINDSSTVNTLCSYFDNIGVFTHYSDDPILKERIYLNSNWLVKTIYEVLDNEDIEKEKGIVALKLISEIWDNKKLEFEFDRLCALMNKFGLMYFVKETNQFVIPEKLPKKMPYESWEHNNSHLLKFKYEFGKYSPKGLMSKIIVNLNKYIKNHRNVWHRGVNIEYEGTYAEIVETYTINNTFEIKISGQNKTGLLAIIIDKFDEILKPYDNLSFEKYVQCICEKCITDENPHFFKYSDLLKRRQKNKEEIECEKDYDKVSVSCILEGIKIDKSKMKKIKIFLASSNELIKERDEIEIFINRENKKLIENNQFIHLERWEDFNDSISKEGLQNEYNKTAIDSDIFISLFSTKVGKFTEEEFDKVHDNFIKNGKPKHIYTFFKNEKKGMNEINEEDYLSLISFQKKLKNLKHYQTNFEDANDLIKQIKLQLDKILPNT